MVPCFSHPYTNILLPYSSGCLRPTKAESLLQLPCASDPVVLLKYFSHLFIPFTPIAPTSHCHQAVTMQYVSY